ncbi:MAG: sulfur carrier protein ThiS adenylyltransferase ThiF [Oscillospiraceae bacterium]
MIPTKEEMFSALCQRHGGELQKRLSAACVAVCGLGGLGSNVAIALARAGVGRLHLIDFDRVDISNLNRQQYAVSQLGMEKTAAMREIIRSIAPYCEVTADTVKLAEDNIAELLSGEQIICECFDVPENKAMLVNTVCEQLPDKFIVAASGMSGLSSANTICTRKLTSKLYICGDGKSDVLSDGTLFSSRVMCCAAHQANMVLRIIAQDYEV